MPCSASSTLLSRASVMTADCPITLLLACMIYSLFHGKLVNFFRLRLSFLVLTEERSRWLGWASGGRHGKRSSVSCGLPVLHLPPPPRDVHATASTIARRLAEQSTGWAMITLALVPTSSACLLEVLLATWSFHKASL